MSVSLRNLHLALNEKLCEIADMLASDYKLTLIARHPTNPNAHIVTSDDDAEKAADVLLHGNLPIVQTSRDHTSVSRQEG